MKTHLVLLAVVMALVTYPSRALPLLAPGIERLPPRVLAYLRLVGPSVLACLAAVNIFVATGSGKSHHLYVGLDAVGVAVCVALVVWRRNLLLGLAAAVAITALARVAL
jgi:branched-subunit amino acid transport protein